MSNKELLSSLFPDWGVNWAEVEEWEEAAEEEGERFDAGMKWDYCEEYASEIVEHSCEVAFKLGELGDEKAVKPLIKLLQGGIRQTVYSNVSELLDEFTFEDDSLAISAAATALGKIGDERATPPLIDILERNNFDAEYDILFSTVVALGLIGSKHAIEPLNKLFEDLKSSDVDDMGWLIDDEVKELRTAITEALKKTN